MLEEWEEQWAVQELKRQNKTWLSGTIIEDFKKEAGPSVSFRENLEKQSWGEIPWVEGTVGTTSPKEEIIRCFILRWADWNIIEGMLSYNKIVTQNKEELPWQPSG